VSIVVIGTFIALVPNMTRTAVRHREEEVAPASTHTPALANTGVLAKAPHA
jgi:hypothetical protein